ncbi:MAG: UvrD-helicase domain-containing protein [Chlamydiota bacterium]
MKLNPEQKKAVQSFGGRVLVLAGAGSGKTRVIIQRILHLILQRNVSPSAILGLTFTNKAAKEMQSRLKEALGKRAEQVLLTTFHSFCVRVLREDIHHLGYTKTFSLYDEKDMQRVLKTLAKEYIDEEKESLSLFVQEALEARTKGQLEGKDPRIQEILERLSTAMRAYNALDFDHLLLVTCTLFENHPQVLEKYQERFLYISIDEYQDTNPVQFRLAELLAAKHQNLFVVGDDDQSIYGFRGAEMKNILTFRADSTIKLEQNYRSIPLILETANHVIRNNKTRYEKRLWCDKQDTSKVSIFHAPSDEEEAKAVVSRLLLLITNRSLNFGDIAILYRSNILARTLEKALLATSYWHEGKLVQGIPYEVFGGLSFSERAEIKDVSAYLKTLLNPLDQESLLRIINVPRKGISDKTLDILTKKARSEQVPLYQLLETIQNEPVSKKAKASIENFLSIMEETKEMLKKPPYAPTLRKFLEDISYKTAIEEDVKSEKMRQFKWENVEAFLQSLEQFEEEFPDSPLEDFVSASSLTRIPLNRRSEENTVKLMTFHSAKGLEFKACFLVGLEDHIVPHEKNHNQEEERRLFYVAITRAQEYLCLSMAKKRKKFGKEAPSNPSRFLFEIPKSCLQVESFRA